MSCDICQKSPEKIEFLQGDLSVHKLPAHWKSGGGLYILGVILKNSKKILEVDF